MSYSSPQTACEAGVSAEIANGKKYDWLLGATQCSDILMVLRNLQEVSQQRRLIAFQRCAQGSYDGGRGQGSSHHQGGRGRQ